LKIEISHDTLAKTVYDKASTEDRMRLMVDNLLKAKYQLFDEEQVYLNSDELKSIAPFEQQLDLTEDEKGFLSSSKMRARSKLIFGVIIFVLTGAIIMGTLFGFAMYYKNNNDIIAEVNTELLDSQDSLKAVNYSLGIKFEELRVKDSIHESLTERIGNHEEIIQMTNKELQDALNELNVLNTKLAESKRRVERERDGLKTDTEVLKERLKFQVNNQDAIIKETLSVVEKSQELSQRAHRILESREKPTDAQYKEAFQLARHAWGMSNSNSQAMDVLNLINNKKITTTSSGFLNGDRPRSTYTFDQIERIIKKVDEQYKYGELSSDEAKRLLRSGR
jgi:hypothetical protein